MTVENNQPSDITADPAAESKPVTPNPAEIRKATTRNILSAVAEATGQSIDSMEDLIRIASVREQAPQRTAQVTPAASADGSALEQIDALRQALHKKDDMMRQRDLQSMVKDKMGDMFEPELSEFVVMKIQAQVKIKEDGSLFVADEFGKTKYREDTGMPYGIDDVVKDVARQYPKTVKQTQQSTGSGIRGGMANVDAAGMPDYASDPAAFNLWASKNGLGKGVGLKGMRATVSSSLKR